MREFLAAISKIAQIQHNTELMLTRMRYNHEGSVDAAERFLDLNFGGSHDGYLRIIERDSMYPSSFITELGMYSHSVSVVFYTAKRNVMSSTEVFEYTEWYALMDRAREVMLAMEIVQNYLNQLEERLSV